MMCTLKTASDKHHGNDTISKAIQGECFTIFFTASTLVDFTSFERRPIAQRRSSMSKNLPIHPPYEKIPIPIFRRVRRYIRKPLGILATILLLYYLLSPKPLPEPRSEVEKHADFSTIIQNAVTCFPRKSIKAIHFLCLFMRM